jgi:enoyl-CoA hydratase/carnithine racemase
MSPSTALMLTEIVEGVGAIRLDRPDKLNAFNAKMVAEFVEAVEAMKAADDVRAIVIGGSTTRAFSAGADMQELLVEIGDERTTTADAIDDLWAAVETCPKPTVAAIDGHCVGAGFYLALCCDIRICSAGARFKNPGVEVGVPLMGTKLTALLGAAAAKRLGLTADTVDAEEGLRIGLVSAIDPDRTAWTTAMAMAGRIASRSPDAVASVKRVIDLASAADPEVRQLELRLIDEVRQARQDHDPVRSAFERKLGR